MCPRFSDTKYILGVEGRLEWGFRFGIISVWSGSEDYLGRGESKAEEIEEWNSEKQRFLEWARFQGRNLKRSDLGSRKEPRDCCIWKATAWRDFSKAEVVNSDRNVKQEGRSVCSFQSSGIKLLALSTIVWWESVMFTFFALILDDFIYYLRQMILN